MSSFKAWLVLDEVLKNTRESILREAVASRATSVLLELASMSLGSSLVKEQLESPEDDEAAEEGNDEDIEREVEELVGSGGWTMEDARRMQHLARSVRWSAMLDRKEAVEEVARILEDDWKPFMRDRREEVSREYEEIKKTGMYESDEEIRLAVGRKMGLTTYEVGKIMADTQNEWSVIKEDENDDKKWKVPEFDDDDDDDDDDGDGDGDGDERLEAIVIEAGPLLVKLGYLQDGQLKFGEKKDKIRALDFAIRNAAREVGNDPPENETTTILASNKGERAKAERDFMEFMAKEYKKIANSTWMRLSQYMGRPDKDDFEDDIKTGGRRGSIHVTDWPDVLTTGIDSVLDSLKAREPTKKGEVPPWKDINLLSKDTVGQIMGSIATRFRPQNITKKAARERRKAAGMSGSSTDDVQTLSGGAMQDDGSRASIDAADTRARDSLTNAVNNSVTNDILNAFRTAMAEIQKKDQLWAMLICARFDLGCGMDGTMPPAAANRLLTLLTGSRSIGMTQTPENFLKKMASVGLPSEGAAEDLLAQKAMKFWDLLKEKKAARIGGLRRSAPLFKSGKPETKEEMAEWKKFKHTVRDACGEGESWLWRKMSELLADSATTTSGQLDHKRWDMLRFLKANFRGAEIKSSNPAPNEHHIKISFPSSAGNAPKVYDILVTNHKDISIMQDGFEDDNEFEIPDPIECTHCRGASSSCPECDGDGMVMNIKAVAMLEYEIRQVLARGHRNTKRKS